MKKILNIILILFLFFACYFIHNLTIKDKIIHIYLGDKILYNYNYYYIDNSCYMDDNYRVIDLIYILKYNEEKKCGNKIESLHKLLNNADVLTISIGYNDLLFSYYNDNKILYSEINDIINSIDTFLKYINRYQFKKVYFSLLYNLNDIDDAYLMFMNYKIKKLLKKYNYDYIEVHNLYSK